MRKLIFFSVVLFSFVACNLDKLEPAQTKAFMKLFGDVGNTEGVDLLKLDDGYLLLGNNSNGVTTAVLIKTDLNGNTLWSTSFENISASALAKNDNSYFIVGDSINESNLLNTRMSLIKTDLDGENHQKNVVAGCRCLDSVLDFTRLGIHTASGGGRDGPERIDSRGEPRRWRYPGPDRYPERKSERQRPV